MTEDQTAVDLGSWFKERPKWMQEAANLLLGKGRLTDDDISTLVDICLREDDSGDATPAASFPADALHAQGASAIRLCAIGNVKGINALAPRSPLNLGPDSMTIVYGDNGSGKSGYVRILKHVCGARNPGTLHPNVFADSGATQSADIKYLKADQECQVSWSINDGVLADLRPVEIFDADRGHVYVESESEVTYEPPALVFFSDLVAVSEQVAQCIDSKLSGYASRKPQIPAECADTAAGTWYASLSGATPHEEVVMHTKWDTEDDTDVSDLEKRLAEKAPGDRAKELLARKGHTEAFIQRIEDLLAKLSDENCRRIVLLNKEKIIKREAAQAAATKVFSGAPLEGIGTDAWKQLWEYARLYSESQAYPHQAFPNLAPEARCVLCHQPLSVEASRRLASFEEFVRGQAEKDAKHAEKTLEDAMTTLGDVPTAQTIRTQCDAAGLAFEGDLLPVVGAVEVLRQRRASLPDAESVDVLPLAPDCSPWLLAAKKQAFQYADAVKKCQEDAATDTRPQLQGQLGELKARRWLSEQRTAIEAEIERLIAVDRLDRARRLTDTRVLSRKKGEIAEVLITEAFVQRFSDELTAIGASRIRVELVKKRVDHGRVLHELRLAQARSGAPTDVLSEGELRVVSLAAFLADVTGKQQAAPLVFDDPISSLDQSFEEAVVQRLVNLSSDRQVIVFTHRLSLVALLQEYRKRKGCEPSVVCVRSEPWGTGEPGDTLLFAKKPDKALNVLLNENLAKARKAYDEEGQLAYTPVAKAICTEFRILLERIIECDLLADVVQRFRRAVTTQGKLAKLAHIKAEDCKFLDDMMTKYSRLEHSQPNEAPVAIPLPSELKMDLEKLRDWRTAFIGRAS